MDLNWIWKSIIIIFIGTILLRIGGRRSISQMTVSQTVIMISIGTLLIQPVSGKNIWVTFGTAALLVVTLIFLEYIQIKSNTLEKLLTGEAVPVIENGTLNEKNLKKLRLSIDKLEMRLRQVNVAKISDVQYATIEPSGQIGYQLKQNKQYATKEDIQMLTNLIQTYIPTLNTDLKKVMWQSSDIQNQYTTQQTTDLFTEVIKKENIPTPPKHLQ